VEDLHIDFQELVNILIYYFIKFRKISKS